jgi:hypothetical protein
MRHIHDRGYEVLGTPMGKDRFIQTFVAQNCLKIMGDIGKHACLTDGFVHAQLLKFCQNTRTQFISANINIPDSDSVITTQHKHVDRKIAYEILQRGTWGSFRKCPQQDIDLAITMLQMPHSMGGFGMTPNVIAQISAKVAMTARFLGFVGSLSSSEQQLWFPNQNVQDPVTWILPHLIQLQHEYKKLVENYNCDIQEFITAQDTPAPPSNILHLPPLTNLHSDTTRNMELPQPGEQRKVQPPSQRTLSRQLMTPKTFHTTSEQDLKPRPCAVNDYPSVLEHEMMTIEPGEKPTCMLTWKTTAFLSHIQPRSHDNRFPIPLWETRFCQSLGVPIPALLENPGHCPCRQFSFDHYGDHIQTCQRLSAALPAHEWIVYRLSLLLRSVGRSQS